MGESGAAAQRKESSFSLQTIRKWLVGENAQQFASRRSGRTGEGAGSPESGDGRAGAAVEEGMMAKDRKQRLEWLQKRFAVIRRELLDLEEKERDEVTIPKLRRFVGQHFKYLNSYGGDSPKWFIYAKITGLIEKDVAFETIEFERTSRNKIEMEYGKRYNGNGENHFAKQSWVPISATEYNRARRSMLKFMEDLLTA